MRRQRLDEPAIPYMFQPGITRRWTSPSGRRRSGTSFASPSARSCAALDPVVPPTASSTVEQRLGRTVALRRLQTMLLLALVGRGAAAVDDRRVRRDAPVDDRENAEIGTPHGARRQSRCRCSAWCSRAVSCPRSSGSGSACSDRRAEPDDGAFPYETSAARSDRLRGRDGGVADGHDDRLSRPRVAGGRVGSDGRVATRLRHVITPRSPAPPAGIRETPGQFRARVHERQALPVHQLPMTAADRSR